MPVLNFDDIDSEEPVSTSPSDEEKVASVAMETRAEIGQSVAMEIEAEVVQSDNNIDQATTESPSRHGRLLSCEFHLFSAFSSSNFIKWWLVFGSV